MELVGYNVICNKALFHTNTATMTDPEAKLIDALLTNAKLREEAERLISCRDCDTISQVPALFHIG